MLTKKTEIDYEAAYIELSKRHLSLDVIVATWRAYVEDLHKRIQEHVHQAIQAGFDATFVMNLKFEQVTGTEKEPTDFGLIDLGKYTQWRWDIFTLIDQECKMALRFVKQSKIIDGVDITMAKTVIPERADTVRVRTMTGWTAMNVDKFVHDLMVELLRD